MNVTCELGGPNLPDIISKHIQLPFPSVKKKTFIAALDLLPFEVAKAVRIENKIEKIVL